MSKNFIKLNGKYYKEVDLNTMSKEQLKELIENVREVKEQVSAQILSPFEVQKERIGTAPWNPNRIGEPYNPFNPGITYCSTNCNTLECCKKKKR